MSTDIELGCGLIAIGREWGTTPEVPSERDALEFLAGAYEAGIRTFDTAPAYGLSEARLGTFLDTLTPQERKAVIVCTKFGEHWNAETQTPYTDHSERAIMTSFFRSEDLLGRISILQVHKSLPEVLRSESVQGLLAEASHLGVRTGASVSDIETAELALSMPGINSLQFPYNQGNTTFADILHRAQSKTILVNRPFQMGAVTKPGEAQSSRHKTAVDVFRFILQTGFQGVVLTGTSNLTHLQQNLAAFEEARASL